MGMYDNITEFHPDNFTEWTVRGDVVEAVFGTYYNLIGGLFFAIIFFLMYTMVYTKTRSMGMTSIVMLFVAVAVSTVVPPEMLSIMFILIALTIGALITAVIKK